MFRIRNMNLWFPKASKSIASIQIFYALFLLFVWSYSISTQSLVICILSNVVLTNFLSVMTWTLSAWIIKKQPNKNFTFGHARYEIIATFLIATLALINSINVVKECFLRLWLYQPDVDTSHIILISFLVLISQIVLIYFNEATRALSCALGHSGLNKIEDMIAKISQKFCRSVPKLSRLLSSRINPFLMFCWINMLFCITLQILAEIYDTNIFDTLFALMLSPLFAMSLWPLFVYTALILMQAAPNHMLNHIDKCLRELSTLEGVLEIRNEHFWSLGFETTVGTLHVRVRRDANEQVVLSHINNRLSNLVSNLTIQVFKDEWAWNRPSRTVHNNHNNNNFNNFSNNKDHHHNMLSNNFSYSNNMNTNGFSTIASNNIISNLEQSAPIITTTLTNGIDAQQHQQPLHQQQQRQQHQHQHEQHQQHQHQQQHQHEQHQQHQHQQQHQQQQQQQHQQQQQQQHQLQQQHLQHQHQQQRQQHISDISDLEIVQSNTSYPPSLELDLHQQQEPKGYFTL